MLIQLLNVLLPLFFAHLLTDFIFQSDESVREKQKIQVLIRHGMIAGALSYLFVGALYGWQIPIGIGVSHSLLDAWKLRTKKGSRLARFLVDQAGHILILFLFSWAASRSSTAGPQIWIPLFGRGYLAALAFLSGAILSVYVGSFIVELAFESLGFSDAASKEGEKAAAEAPRETSGIADGGRMIGYLERGLIYLFILAGYPAGIGFLVAAKSIFRFGELTDANRRFQAEYIIIGTLLSILFGSAVSYLTAEILVLLQP